MSHRQAGATGSKASSAVFVQRREELDRKERIAAGLLVHQLGQRPSVLRLAMQGVGDEPANIVEPERVPARSPGPLRPASRIASSVRISGCAGPTSLSR